MSKSTCGSRSILLTTTSSQARNMSGYLSGLSSPSATERDHRAGVLAHPELGRADQVADVLDQEQVDLVEGERRQRRAHHVGVQVALAAEPGVGVELGDRHVQSGEPVGVEACPARRPRARPRARRSRSGRGPAPAASSCPPRGAHQVDHRHARRGRSRRGWPRRSWCSRPARPRPPSPWCDACVLLLDLDRLHLELVARRRPRLARRRSAGQRKPASSSSHSAPQSSQRSRAGHQLRSSRAPSQTVSRATISK